MLYNSFGPQKWILNLFIIVLITNHDRYNRDRYDRNRYNRHRYHGHRYDCMIIISPEWPNRDEFLASQLDPFDRGSLLGSFPETNLFRF